MTEDIRWKYSDPASGDSGSSPGLFYAVDSGSPLSSVALGSIDRVLVREFQVGDSSSRLITDLDDLLAEIGAELADVEGLLALRGPGSFTGLRVGLATLLGLHQALEVRATAVSTFAALAWQARRRVGPSERPILACVDALRGQRFAQTFDGHNLRPQGQPELVSNAALASRRGALVTGFGLEALRELLTESPEASELLEANALASDLVAIASQTGFSWDAATLTEPLYLRPPVAAPGT